MRTSRKERFLSRLLRVRLQTRTTTVRCRSRSRPFPPTNDGKPRRRWRTPRSASREASCPAEKTSAKAIRSSSSLGGATAAAKREDNQKLEALGRAAPTGRVAPWLALSATSVLVVPRLSALVALAGLEGELHAGCPDARTTNR